MTGVNPIGVSLGASLGAASLTVDTISLCISAFDAWQAAENTGEDVQEIKIRIRCAAARLKIWKLEWGMELNAHLQNPRMLEFGDIAADYVAMIHLIGSRLEDLDSGYMTVSSSATASTSLLQRLSALAGIDSFQRQTLQTQIREMRNNTSIFERFQWALRNKKMVVDSLNRAEYLIDGLYKILSPPAHDPAAHIATNPAFSSQNLQEIKTIKDLPGLDPTLGAVSSSKLATIRIKTRTTTLGDEVKSRKSREITKIISEDTKNSRDVRILKSSGSSVDVLVEWKMIPSDGKMIELERRVKDIGCLLKADEKPIELKTLSCIGIVQDRDKDTQETKLGLIYSVPSRDFYSLRTILSQDQQPLLLGQRFEIAHILVRTVWYLHLSDWLHKGIRSDNILFFGDSFTEASASNVFLVGFDHSRENQRGAATEDVRFDAETDLNLYRHLACQGVPFDLPSNDPSQGTQMTRFRPSFLREFDLFSMGVILLELGHNRTIGYLHERNLQKLKKNSLSADDIKKWMIDNLAAELGVKMGKMYQDAALLCLRGNFQLSPDRLLGEAFYADVVWPLAQCKA